MGCKRQLRRTWTDARVHTDVRVWPCLCLCLFAIEVKECTPVHGTGIDLQELEEKLPNYGLEP